MDASYLARFQPLLYQTVTRAFEHQKIAHAYLIAGEAGTPLKQTALYLAMSLVCEKPEPLACGQCLSCLRFEDGSYVDFLLIDSEQEAVKKEAIRQLESDFARTGLEKSGKLIYVIHLVENLSTDSANLLLKFLEEPKDNVFAFLTTANIAKVLPTITSRAQLLPLRLINPKIIVEQCLKEDISQADAEILAHFENEMAVIKERANSEDYREMHANIIELIEALGQSSSAAIYLVQAKISRVVNKKEKARLFLDLLSLFIQDLINVKLKQPLQLNCYKQLLEKAAINVPNPVNGLITTLEMRGKLDLNLNISLVLDVIINALVRE